MAQEWESIKRFQLNQQRQRVRDKSLESVGTPDNPYVQELTAEQKALADHVLRERGLSDSEISERNLKRDQAVAASKLKKLIAKVQGMSVDELALEITKPEFEELPKALQDALIAKILKD